ncbi:SRPBCC domain-containing protein [Phenylobacterium sp.]|uniref:SRPBCC domain-containing protein n=1 Tax=Phenylobacterium sp. TaxID=1871053 RepID=UPI000AFA9FE4|nr:SRPBCC domain-containing protein [Phenylobacterium sp.]
MLSPNRNDSQLRPSFMPGFGFGKKKQAAGPKGLKVEHRIGVQAPPDVLWENLADPAAWPEWNPLYSRAEGRLAIGAPLSLTLTLPEQAPREVRAQIVDWVPNEQIHWRTSVAGGFGTAIRYIEIEQVADHACILSNGEWFLGLLGPRSAKRIQRPLRRGFAAMGEALKERAEAAWRARA